MLSKRDLLSAEAECECRSLLRHGFRTDRGVAEAQDLAQETEADAGSLFVRSEKRYKDSFQRFLYDADAVVLDSNNRLPFCAQDGRKPDTGIPPPSYRANGV